MKKWLWMGVGIVAVAGIVTASLLYRLHPFLPPNLAKKVPFSVYVPEKPYKVDRSTIKFDDKERVLSFVTTGSNPMTLTEQAMPDAMADVPTLYPKMLDTMQQYANVETAVGRVTLTHPVELKGHQAAVFSGRGTLIFVRPAHDLDTRGWQDFFDVMTVQH